MVYNVAIAHYLRSIEEYFMSQFTDTLSNLLKKHNKTLFSLAQDTGIDRTLLSKITSGKRSLTVRNFSKILESIQITQSEITALKEIYISEYFGKERFEKYLEILSRISAPANYQTDSDFVRISIDSDTDSVRFHSQRELINIMDALIGNAICDGKKSERIYLNIDCEAAFEIIQKYSAYLSNSDFRMFIQLNECDTDEFFEKAVKCTSVSVPIRYFKSGNASSNPFPYFMTTGEYTVLTDSDFKEGVLIKNQILSDAYAEKFLKAFDGANSFVSRCDNILNLKEEMIKNSCPTKSESEFMVYTNSVDCVCFMTLDMWDQIAREYVPQREFLKVTTYEYYKNVVENEQSSTRILQRSALTRFVEQGLVEYMPRQFAYPLSPENRLEVLKRIREYESKEENNFYLVRDELGSALEVPFWLDTSMTDDNSTSVSLGIYDFNAPMQFIGNTFAIFNDENVYRKITDFFSIFTVSPYCYSQKESLAILDEEIRKLEIELSTDSMKI